MAASEEDHSHYLNGDHADCYCDHYDDRGDHGHHLDGDHGHHLGGDHGHHVDGDLGHHLVGDHGDEGHCQDPAP